MIYLTLNNGTRIEVQETSTPNSIVVQGAITEIDNALSEITTDNLKNADLNGTTLVNKVYTGFSGTCEDGLYTVTFALRDKTDMEVMREEISEVQDALIELAGE